MNSELPLIRLFCESRYCYYKIRTILRNHSAYISFSFGDYMKSTTAASLN